MLDGPCTTYAESERLLNEKYHEVVTVARGLSGDGQAWELRASKDGATWTAISISTDGIVCLLQSGVSLEWARRPGEPA